MASYLNTNILGIEAQRNLSISQSAETTALQRLSTGLRINSAKDDAAGLAIASSMTSQINGDNQAAINVNDGISLLQTAGSAMGSITDNLQRIRVLSLQAANASNTMLDRQVLNNEVQRNKAEIQQLATTTAYNGMQLLDGSINAMLFQVGANQNDTITIGTIQNMQLSQLGSSAVAYSATVTGNALGSALNAGDLTLNGVSVGASKAGKAQGEEASSAWAVASAINNVSDSSGVAATATTTLTGNAPSSISTIQDFSINGVDIGSVGAGSNAASQGANLAAAITGASGQSGVTATSDATGALTLTATNGQNIDIELSGTAANVATAATDRAAFLAQTGLPDSAVGTQASSAVAAKHALTISGHISAGANFNINGVAFTVNDSNSPSNVVDSSHVNVNLGLGSGNNSAAVASALNSAVTLAQSDSQTSAVLSTITTSDNGTGTVFINDNSAGASSTSISSTTGSVSTIVKGEAGAAASAASTSGVVTLNGLTQSGILIGGASAANAGFTNGQVSSTILNTMPGIASLNVLTQSAAENAIAQSDSAISMVNDTQAQIGAYENRFTSAAANIQTCIENASSSRSVIEDTNYASEIANLIKTKIFQQAGMAVLTQANTSPSMIIRLLR